MSSRHLPPNGLDTRPGAAIYSSLVLKVYDAWVLGVSNRWAWRCETERVLVPFYRKHAGRRHLDVGVGTGYYLARAGLEKTQHLYLLDLNENSLASAARRSGRSIDGMFVADAMRPVPELAKLQFDSIALFYLLHCLPGRLADKAAVLTHLVPHLCDDGSLYGATILGDSAPHNAFGRKLMSVYNRKGIFGNRHDTANELRDVLETHFRDVQIQQVGVVALFVAKYPRRQNPRS